MEERLESPGKKYFIKEVYMSTRISTMPEKKRGKKLKNVVQLIFRKPTEFNTLA